MLILVMLSLDIYHVSVLNVSGNWLLHVIEYKMSTINIDEEVKTNSVYTGIF